MLQNRWGTLAAASVTACLMCSCGGGQLRSDGYSPYVERKVFTPEHTTLKDSVREFFGWRSPPVQPIAFPHNKHLAQGVECSVCHIGVRSGPVAGIPSDKLCMGCHEVLANDRPEVQKLAAYFNAGRDVPWERIYGFAPSAHVKFNHAPHIRAGIDCSACHGDLAKMSVAIKAVQINMGFCLRCHRARRVSTDCITCHF